MKKEDYSMKHHAGNTLVFLQSSNAEYEATVVLSNRFQCFPRDLFQGAR